MLCRVPKESPADRIAHPKCLIGSRAQAAQKGVKIGDTCWVRAADKKAVKPFETASVVNVQQGGARVTVKREGSSAEESLDTAKEDLFPANEKGMMPADHCALIHLNEPCVLENTALVRARLGPAPAAPTTRLEK
jgi:hypothetical protein